MRSGKSISVHERLNGMSKLMEAEKNETGREEGEEHAYHHFSDIMVIVRK
jgi:hypothetical protein